jgi:hypothetical protein
MNAHPYVYADTGPLPPIPKASASTTASAIWFVTTIPSVQVERRPTARTASSRRSKRHRSRSAPARTSEGATTSAWRATPAVVPRPKSKSRDDGADTEPRVGVGSIAANHKSTATHTTLFVIGAHAGAAKRPRTLSSAVASESRP